MEEPHIRAVAERFLSAFNSADLAAMRSLLDDDLVAYTTNAAAVRPGLTAQPPIWVRSLR